MSQTSIGADEDSLITENSDFPEKGLAQINKIVKDIISDPISLQTSIVSQITQLGDPNSRTKRNNLNQDMWQFSQEYETYLEDEFTAIDGVVNEKVAEIQNRKPSTSLLHQVKNALTGHPLSNVSDYSAPQHRPQRLLPVAASANEPNISEEAAQSEEIQDIETVETKPVQPLVSPRKRGKYWWFPLRVLG